MSAHLSALAVLAGVAGAVNQAVQASRFGTSPEMGVYFGLLSTIQVITGMAPAVFSNVIVPRLASSGAAWQSSTRTMSAAVLCTAVAASLFGILGSQRHVAEVLPALTGPLLNTAVATSRVLWLWVGVSLLYCFLSAVHQVHGHFIRVCALAMLPSACSAAFAAIWGGRLGILSMALGLLAGSLIQVASLLMRSPASFAIPRAADFDRRESLQLLYKMLPAIVAMLPATAAPAIVIAAAHRINPWDAAQLGYCNSFATLLSVATGYGVGVVALRSLARHRAHGESDVVSAMAEARLRYVLVLGTIVAVATWSVRSDLIRFLFQRGQFNLHSTETVAWLLPWFLVVSVCAACQTVLRSIFNATGRHLIPAYLGAGMIAVLYVASVECTSNTCVAAAYSATSLLYTVAAIALLKGPSKSAIFLFGLKLATSSALAIGCAAALQKVLPEVQGPLLSAARSLLPATFAMIGFIVSGIYIARIAELQSMLAFCRTAIASGLPPFRR